MTSRRFIAHLEQQMLLFDAYWASRVGRRASTLEEQMLFGALRRANRNNIADWRRTLDLI